MIGVFESAGSQTGGRNTPCALDGKCHDCRSKERICNGMNILLAPMGGMPAEVLLIDEELGI